MSTKSPIHNSDNFTDHQHSHQHGGNISDDDCCSDEGCCSHDHKHVTVDHDHGHGHGHANVTRTQKVNDDIVEAAESRDVFPGTYSIA